MKEVTLTQNQLVELLLLATKWENYSTVEDLNNISVSLAKHMAILRIIDQKVLWKK